MAYGFDLTHMTLCPEEDDSFKGVWDKLAAILGAYLRLPGGHQAGRG